MIPINSIDICLLKNLVVGLNYDQLAKDQNVAYVTENDVRVQMEHLMLSTQTKGCWQWKYSHGAMVIGIFLACLI